MAKQEQFLTVTHPLLQVPPLHAKGRLSVKLGGNSGRYNLRIAATDVWAAAQAFGTSIPLAMGEMSQTGQRRAACVGPDEWLLIAPSNEMGTIADAFGRLSITHSLVDVSDREILIEITGQAASYALMACCPLDLDRMKTSWATRTLFDHADVLIIKEDAERFQMSFLRSWSEHVWGLLDTIALEITAGL